MLNTDGRHRRGPQQQPIPNQQARESVDEVTRLFEAAGLSQRPPSSSRTPQTLPSSAPSLHRPQAIQSSSNQRPSQYGAETRATKGTSASTAGSSSKRRPLVTEDSDVGHEDRSEGEHFTLNKLTTSRTGLTFEQSLDLEATHPQGSHVAP